MAEDDDSHGCPYEYACDVYCITNGMRSGRCEGKICKCSVLGLHCWDNCNNRKTQVINSDEDDDDDDEPIRLDDLVEASLSLHVEEDTDDLPKDIGP
ncbi:hypothetical protein AVEN_107552-1 [Araneus ventricosus]|uniref:Uncharacterized protein n=1 Tax=Araneus ventricosus TaxID=182803 RepID=A0A4Y2RFC1_ARAVE|nr:hypothetical protein AVEN_107552-1 [Araneus ventricosus]